MDSKSTSTSESKPDPDTSKITRAEFYNWKDKTIGDPYTIWHDGLYVEWMGSLKGGAREEALIMLHRGLEDGDSDCATALAAMGDVSAAPKIRDKFSKSGDREKVVSTLAIHELVPDESLVNKLIEVLKNRQPCPSSYLDGKTRMDAALGLRNFSGEAVEHAFLDAVEHDPSYHVRYHSYHGLVSQCKIKLSSQEDQEIFKLICLSSGTSFDNKTITAEDQAKLSEARQRLEKHRLEKYRLEKPPEKSSCSYFHE
jgi:hypothetical protein